MSSQSQKSQALLSLWGHLVLTSIAKQTHTHTHNNILVHFIPEIIRREQLKFFIYIYMF